MTQPFSWICPGDSIGLHGAPLISACLYAYTSLDIHQQSQGSHGRKCSQVGAFVLFSSFCMLIMRLLEMWFFGHIFYYKKVCPSSQSRFKSKISAITDQLSAIVPIRAMKKPFLIASKTAKKNYNP